MRRLPTLATVLALTATLASCGGGDDSDGDKPSASDVPESAVAVVGDAEISNSQLRRRVAALRRAQPQAAKGQQAAKPAQDQLEQQALSILLQGAAIEQEAADRGIEVSNAEVRKRWDAVAKSQFRNKKALRRFLGGQTKQDIVRQLRLQTLTERIHEQVSEEAGGGKKGAKAVQEFQKSFQERWRDRTACRDGQSAAGCQDTNASE